MELRKVIIALDSFKGCLSSLEAGKALAEGIREASPKTQSLIYSVADGGEGSIEALLDNCGGQLIELEVKDPLLRPVRAGYALLKHKKALIEMAKASGLPLLSPELRNPLETTSYGVGQLIADALDRGVNHLILAIGGSATNDAGMGMFSALGVRFLDSRGQELNPIGKSLGDVCSIDESRMHPQLKNCAITVACDVDNPLYGERGAAHVYGPQKGADPEMVEFLDKGARHFAQIIKELKGKDIAHLPGAGAAGGLGAGLLAFTSASLMPGIDIILEQIGFEESLVGADLVFVGEGRLDRQTAMGKAPMGIAKRAKARNIPVIAVGGAIAGDTAELHAAGIDACFAAVARPMGLEQAMNPDEARLGLKRQGREIMGLIQSLG